jgi:excinuclease ABC subunit A
VIKLADWIIDLGPEGGSAGGEIVAMGRPEDVANVEESHTGRWLKPLLKKRPANTDISPRVRSAGGEIEDFSTQLAL